MIFKKRQKRYYLDNAAHTPIDPNIAKRVYELQLQGMANPLSIHTSGKKSGEILRESIGRVRSITQTASDCNVVFTSGGTEANHIAVDSAINAWKRGGSSQTPVIVISAIEHPSVRDYVQARDDVELVILSVDSLGHVDTNDLQKILSVYQDRLALVSVIYQSSEIGSCQDIPSISKIIKKYKQSDVFPLVHVDMAQGVPYSSIHMQSMGVDFLSLCGQKMYGPMGVGVLLDTQNLAKRQGTPSIPLIVGIREALSHCMYHHEYALKSITSTKENFFRILNEQKIGYEVNGASGDKTAIINLTFDDTKKDSEQLIVSMDNLGLEVSSKSACMGSQASDSYVLDALGKKPSNSVRITLSETLNNSDLREIVLRIKKTL